MKPRELLALISIVAIWAAIARPSCAATNATPLSPYWQGIAASRLIVSAEVLSVKETTLPAPYSFKTGEFRVRVRQILREEKCKVRPNDEITIELIGHSFVGMKSVSPGEELLFFLDGVTSDALYCESGGFDHHPRIAAHSLEAANVEKELENQKTISTQDFTAMEKVPAKLDAQISRLVEQLRVSETEEEAMTKLQALAPSAVPALVRRLSDHRPTAFEKVNVPTVGPVEPDNGMARFESFAVARPTLITDALDIALGVITRADFGDGETDADRKNISRGWHIYLFYSWHGHKPVNPSLALPATRAKPYLKLPHYAAYRIAPSCSLL
jgi:hypothetical protein